MTCFVAADLADLSQIAYSLQTQKIDMGAVKSIAAFWCYVLVSPICHLQHFAQAVCENAEC